jgi:hypothetical protein
MAQDTAPAKPADPSKPEPEAEPKPPRRHLVLDICVIVGVIVLYALSLFGYHWLASTPGPLPRPDVGTTNDTVVLVRFEQLHTVSNRLDVKVKVLPDDSMRPRSPPPSRRTVTPPSGHSTPTPPTPSRPTCSSGPAINANTCPPASR